MKQHLNTLFVTTQDTWLSKEGECVVLSLEGEKLGKIPLHTLQSIACFGHVACSQYLLERCAQLGITVTWFTEYGRFMAAMQGPTTGNVLLRRAQYRLADSPEASARLARFFLIGSGRRVRRGNPRLPPRSRRWAASSAACFMSRISPCCAVWKGMPRTDTSRSFPC